MVLIGIEMASVGGRLMSVLLLLLLLMLFILIPDVDALSLTGTGSSHARFPPWAGCINASFSFEFRTTQPVTPGHAGVQRQHTVSLKITIFQFIYLANADRLAAERPSTLS